MNIPRFVKIKNSILRLVGENYYRDAGDWNIEYRTVDNVLVSWLPRVKHIHNIPMVESTEEEWRESNQGYISHLTHDMIYEIKDHQPKNNNKIAF